MELTTRRQALAQIATGLIGMAVTPPVFSGESLQSNQDLNTALPLKEIANRLSKGEIPLDKALLCLGAQDQEILTKNGKIDRQEKIYSASERGRSAKEIDEFATMIAAQITASQSRLPAEEIFSKVTTAIFGDDKNRNFTSANSTSNSFDAWARHNSRHDLADTWFRRHGVCQDLSSIVQIVFEKIKQSGIDVDAHTIIVPGHVLCRVQLGDSDFAIETTKDSAAKILIPWAENLPALRNRLGLHDQQALPICYESAGKTGAFVAALLNSALILKQRGLGDFESERLEAAVALAPHNPCVREKYGEYLLRNHNVAAARQEAFSAIASDLGSADAHDLLLETSQVMLARTRIDSPLEREKALHCVELGLADATQADRFSRHDPILGQWQRKLELATWYHKKFALTSSAGDLEQCRLALGEAATLSVSPSPRIISHFSTMASFSGDRRFLDDALGLLKDENSYSKEMRESLLGLKGQILLMRNDWKLAEQAFLRLSNRQDTAQFGKLIAQIALNESPLSPQEHMEMKESIRTLLKVFPGRIHQLSDFHAVLNEHQRNWPINSEPIVQRAPGALSQLQMISSALHNQNVERFFENQLLQLQK